MNMGQIYALVGTLSEQEASKALPHFGINSFHPKEILPGALLGATFRLNEGTGVH